MKKPIAWMLLAGALAGPLGFLVGRAFPAQAPDEEVRRLLREQGERLASLKGPAPEPGRCTAVSALSASDAAAIKAELARLVREELHGAKGEASPAVATKDKLPEPSSDAVAATAEAYRVIDEALGARRWTERDAESFRRLLPKLTDEQRQEVTHKLTVTLNERRVAVDVVGPPY